MIVSWMMIPLLTLNLRTKKVAYFCICLTVVDVVICSVDNNNTTVGHLPRKFSCLLWHFLSHRGEMEYEGLEGNGTSIHSRWIGDFLLCKKSVAQASFIKTE